MAKKIKEATGVVVGLGFGLLIIAGFSYCTIHNFNAGPSEASKPPGPAHIKSDTFACQSRKFIHRFYQIYDDGDKDTAMDLLRRAIGSGQCAEFNKGDPIYIDSATFAMRKIRPQGGTTDYWIEAELVDP